MNVEQARERLSAERERLTEVRDAASRLSTTTNEATQGEVSNSDQHPAEQATETLERELDQGVLITVEAELAEVESAIGRIDAGTYGTCEVCGREIADGRLEAMPAARYCIDDQARAEKDPLLRN